jgi:hypothetical protein
MLGWLDSSFRIFTYRSEVMGNPSCWSSTFIFFMASCSPVCLSFAKKTIP